MLPDQECRNFSVIDTLNGEDRETCHATMIYSAILGFQNDFITDPLIVRSPKERLIENVDKLNQGPQQSQKNKNIFKNNLLSLLHFR